MPPAEFRRSPAYAKNGRERYGLIPTYSPNEGIPQSAGIAPNSGFVSKAGIVSNDGIALNAGITPGVGNKAGAAIVPGAGSELHAETERWFAACLVETSDKRTPVTARAARAYLDVAFFHPYDDGNARLAGLVLQFVLLRERICLDELGPILTTVRRADDVDGAAGLARLVHGTAAATSRRFRSAQRGDRMHRGEGDAQPALGHRDQ